MKKGRSPAGVGGILLLSVLLILSLTLFAALSFVTAQADLRLSEKNASFTAQYYEADAKGEEIAAYFYSLADVPAGEEKPDRAVQCREALENKFPGIAFSVTEENGELYLSCQVPLQDGTQSLFISLSLPQGRELRRVTWKLGGTESGDAEEIAEDTMPLWTGEEGLS